MVLDASVHGFGAHFQATPDATPHELISTPPQNWDWTEQVYREGAAYALCVAASTHRCKGRVMLVVSDCDPVVHSAAKGSKGSDILHYAVQHAALAAVADEVDLAVLWAPGQAMVDWGIDALSRDVAGSLHDAQVGPQLWERAVSMAEDHGGFSVDWFADATSHQLPRYWARFADGGAEGVDALLAPSWCQGTCECGLVHREVGWFFPPLPLVGPMLAKAKREGACGVALLPMKIGEPWWPLVEEAAYSTWEVTGIEHPFTNPAPAYCTKTFAWLLCAFAFDSSATPLPACDLWAQRQVRQRSPVIQHAHDSLVTVEKALAALAREQLLDPAVGPFGELVDLEQSM